MVPLQRFAFEEDDGEEGEDDEGYNFLDDFELHQRECAAVAGEAYAVGGYLEAVFGQGYSPRQQDDGIERCVVANDFELLELEMAIPGESHEYVGNDE